MLFGKGPKAVSYEGQGNRRTEDELLRRRKHVK